MKESKGTNCHYERKKSRRRDARHAGGSSLHVRQRIRVRSQKKKDFVTVVMPAA